jgi:cytochrome c553
VRVVNIFPKDNPFMDDPNMGVAAQSLGRGVLGVAPVEADGSAHFTVPAGAPVYFQLLDEDGLAVQTMRSDTYVHPGETLTCTGCHEPRQKRATAQSATPPLALRRPPSALRREVEGAFPLTFPRLVQPVLNAHCVECHAREPKAPGLRGDRFGEFGWSESFLALRNFAWGRSGGNGIAASERQFSLPGKEGARASKLLRLLDGGHYAVTLPPLDRRRLTLWLDCNSNFYAAYSATEHQACGGLIAPRWGLPRWVSFESLMREESAAR